MQRDYWKRIRQLHTDNTNFREKLQRSVRLRIFGLVGAGMLLLAIGMLWVAEIGNYRIALENRNLLADSFRRLDRECRTFLTDSGVMEASLGSILYDGSTDRIHYLLYTFNASAPLGARLVVSDKERHMIYSSFEPGDWNRYRNSFQRAICDNAFKNQSQGIYTSVYYGQDDGADYVLSAPIFHQDKVVGYVNLYLPDTAWTAALASSQHYDGIITDGLGRIIYSSQSAFASPIHRFSPSRERGRISFGDSWYQLSGIFLPREDIWIYSLVYRPRNHTLLLVGFSIILFLGVSWFFMAQDMSDAMAESNAAGVRRLVEEMDIIERGEHLHRIDMGSRDEFEAIGMKINRMLDSIQELNEHNTELLELKRIAEMNQLTAQFHPHFLYNTLETLRNLLFFSARSADQLIIKLTRILRYSIDDRNEEVPLQRDMEYLRDYLDIQACRYGERLSCEISLEDACLSCMVPKLLIQPLIENSIKYGFQDRMDLHIWVDGYVSDKTLYLSVTDNGSGMSDDRLAMLNDEITKDGFSSHKGLKNISRRLLLGYGSNSGVRVSSPPGGGLKVLVRVAQQGGPGSQESRQE